MDRLKGLLDILIDTNNISSTMDALNGSNDTTSDAKNISDDVVNITAGQDLPLYLRVPSWCVSLAQIFIALAVFIGFLGNVILLAVFKRDKKRSSTTIYIIWLAVANLVPLTFNGPGDILRFSALWSYVGSIWICRLLIYAQYAVFVISAILVFCIGLDRFLKVYRPYSSQKLRKISKKLCPVIFGVSLAVFIPVLTMVYQDERGQCLVDRDSNTVVKIAYRIASISIIASSFPLCFFYFKIAQFMRRKSKVRDLPITRVGGGHSAPRSSGRREEGRKPAGLDIAAHLGRPSTPLGKQPKDVSITTSKQEHTITNTQSSRLTPNSLVVTQPKEPTRCPSQNSTGKIFLTGGGESTLTPIEAVEKACSMTAMTRTTLPDTGNTYSMTSLHGNTFGTSRSILSNHTEYDSRELPEVSRIHVASAGQGNDQVASTSIGEQEHPVSDQTHNKELGLPRPVGGRGPAIILPSTSGQQYRAASFSRGGQEQRGQTNQGRRTTTTMALITVVFFLTTVFPILVQVINNRIEGQSLGVDILMFFAFKLPYLNYASNAILYTFSSTEFRKNVKKLFQDMR